MSAPCQIWVPQTSHLIKYFWIRMVTTLTDSVFPLANHTIMHQIPYLRKHWLTRRWKREQAQTFSIYIHAIHAFFCVLTASGVLCANLIWTMLDLSEKHVEILIYTYLSQVFCWSKLALTKMLLSRNLKLQSLSKNIHDDSHKNQLLLYLLKRLNFRFLTFLLISCPIESFKTKLGPSAFIPYVAKSLNWQNIKVSVFCERLATLGSTALWGPHI